MRATARAFRPSKNERAREYNDRLREREHRERLRRRERSVQAEKAAATAISQAGFKQSTWWEDDADGRDISREWRK